MPCVDFAEAKGGVLHCHWDSHHYRHRTEMASAVMNFKISLLTSISNAASERTFSKEQDWQGTLFGVGPGHYGCNSVCSKKNYGSHDRLHNPGCSLNVQK